MLTLRDILDYAELIVPADPRSAIKARIQQMQRLGFPAGVNSSSKRRAWVRYDLDKVMVIGVCLAIANAGVPLSEAVNATEQGLLEIRTAYSEAAAERYRLGDFLGPARWRLVVERGVGIHGKAVRFDVLSTRETSSLDTLGASAILIDIRRLFDALEAVAPDQIEGLRLQAQAVLDNEGSNLLMAGDISVLFGSAPR